MSATLTLPLLEQPSPLVSDHDASIVIDLLGTHGWTTVTTPEANIHATSPDGRVHVGWLPEDPDAWTRRIVFRVNVTPDDAPAWPQEFGIDTPPVTVAAFLLPFLTDTHRTTS